MTSIPESPAKRRKDVVRQHGGDLGGGVEWRRDDIVSGIFARRRTTTLLLAPSKYAPHLCHLPITWILITKSVVRETIFFLLVTLALVQITAGHRATELFGRRRGCWRPNAATKIWKLRSSGDVLDPNSHV